MKHIVKNQEPQQFLEWKKRDKMVHRPNWNRVSGTIKQAIHEALITEQGRICCYCESSVTSEDSHVEHFRPRSQFPSLELDYQNLHCSCLRTVAPGEPVHCGHSKGSWFDSELLISPLQQGCEKRFRFAPNGEIRPRRSDDRAAATTIRRLGLDLPKLNRLRAAAVAELRGLSAEQVREFLVRGAGGFPPYFTTVEDVLL